MRVLCRVGLHQALWMPVVVLISGATDWLQVRRCVNCGRVVG